MRLATHYRDTWLRRLWAPTRIRPQLGDRFLMDYYPHPLGGGPPLLPYARRPPRAPPKSVLLAAPQSSRPPGVGSGTQGALCLGHGTPLCPRCRSPGWASAAAAVWDTRYMSPFHPLRQPEGEEARPPQASSPLVGRPKLGEGSRRVPQPGSPSLPGLLPLRAVLEDVDLVLVRRPAVEVRGVGLHAMAGDPRRRPQGPS